MAKKLTKKEIRMAMNFTDNKIRANDYIILLLLLMFTLYPVFTEQS